MIDCVDAKRGVLTAVLKAARDSWRLSLEEMWCGRLISRELKDAGINQHAANHVLLIATLLRW